MATTGVMAINNALYKNMSYDSSTDFDCVVYVASITNVLIVPAAWMGGGGVVGAVIGALVAVEVPGPILARIWGAFLVFSAYRLLLQGVKPSPKTP